jgi:hypothetical protein
MKQNDHHWHLSAFNTEHKQHIELELRICQCIYEASMIKLCGYIDRSEFSTKTIMDMLPEKIYLPEELESSTGQLAKPTTGTFFL